MAGHSSEYQPPEDPRTPLWRYMKFDYYKSMLSNGGLYFARADKLGDPLEGSYPLANKQLYEHQREEWARPVPDADRDSLLETWRKHTWVSCWHMNEHESAYMWERYAPELKSVAVRTTYQRLDDLLDYWCFLGVVRYIDLQQEVSNIRSSREPFVIKDKEFEPEREVRAVWQPTSSPPFEPDYPGRWVPVDLNQRNRSANPSPPRTGCCVGRGRYGGGSDPDDRAFFLARAQALGVSSPTSFAGWS